MKSWPWKWAVLGVCSLLFFVGSSLIFNSAQQGTNLEHVSQKLSQAFDKAHDQAIKELDQIQLPPSDSQILSAPARPYRFKTLIYNQDTLVQWNSNQPPVNGSWEVRGRGGTIISLRNGDYLVAEREEGPWLAVSLIPVQRRYSIENEYLKSRWAFPQKLPTGATFQLTKTNDTIPQETVVNPTADEPYGYLQYNTTPEPVIPSLGVLLYFLGWLFLLILAVLSASWLVRKFSLWLALIYLLLALSVMRWYLLFPGYPKWLSYLPLFNPQQYAQSALLPSLGDLFLFVLIGFIIAVFFNWHGRQLALNNGIRFTLVGVAGVVVIFFLGYVVMEIIESLVLDSNISFNLNDFFSLTRFTFVGLLLLGMALTAWFLISYRLVSIWYRHGNRKPLIPVVAGVVLFILAMLPWAIPKDVFISLALGLLVLIGLYLTHRLNWSIRTFWYQVGWMAGFAIVLAVLLYRFNDAKELQVRKLYVNVLLQEDHLTEFIFDQVKGDIQEDAFIRGFFQNPLLSKRQLNERLNVLYFKGYLSKYDIQVHSYLKNNIPYKNAEPVPLNQFFIRIDSSGRTTPVQDLYFFPEAPNGLEYMAMLRIFQNPDRPNFREVLGRLVIEFKTKSITASTLYPELLLSESVKPSKLFADYDYAIYANSKLVRKQGYASYPLFYNGNQSSSESYEERIINDKSHLIYEGGEGNTIWITAPGDKPAFEVLSLFSSIFILLFVVLLIAQAAYGLWNWVQGKWKPRGIRHISFRVRIQYAIVAVILVSFITIGTITIQNTNNQYEQYHSERLQRKARQILAGLEYERTNIAGFENSWTPLLNSNDLNLVVTSLSEIHNMDINLFGREGLLLEASQPAIFDKGLMANWIDPNAYHQLLHGEESQVIQSERIGKLSYLSAYIPLINRDNRIQAILHLPYYAQEKNQDEEINSFLTFFINIYVLLFLLAGGLGIVISNSVTRPITTIGSKMKQVQLGRRNEPILWKGQDEIGRMIEQYNKMILQLEESARQLAQTERESAWREMAKQVAHEIKNPLTPMKLSIQLLQRAAKDESADMSERVDKVANTLIEQIEHLSHIASEFSSFAKMPPAKIEPLVINDLVKSVVDLFKNEEVELEASIPEQPYVVMADKSQLVRVFNNLIKNAIQAIPDEKPGKIFVALRKEVDHVTVKVEDNGIGIPDDQKDKVFVPNFTTKSSGTGLGLAMSKNMVEFVKGTIWFDSEAGLGTTFYVTLPISQRH